MPMLLGGSAYVRRKVAFYMIRLFVALFLSALLALPAAAQELVEGGLYVVGNEGVGYRPLKIVKLDAEGVHVRMFSNVYSNVPARIRQDDLLISDRDLPPYLPFGFRHIPFRRASFEDLKPIFVERSAVSADEMSDYEVWLGKDGGYL